MWTFHVVFGKIFLFPVNAGGLRMFYLFREGRRGCLFSGREAAEGTCRLADERFDKLVADYGRKVLHIAQGVLGDPQAAMDVHQEVFLAIWKRWHTFDEPVNWDGYLYRTTIRKALDYARKLRKEKSLDPEYEKQIPSTNNPELKARASELVSLLRNYMQKLPSQQAQAFMLARLEGLGYPQIAAAMGCSEGTARVHLHRALKQLAHEMRDVL